METTQWALGLCQGRAVTIPSLSHPLWAATATFAAAATKPDKPAGQDWLLLASGLTCSLGLSQLPRGRPSPSAPWVGGVGVTHRDNAAMAAQRGMRTPSHTTETAAWHPRARTQAHAASALPTVPDQLRARLGAPRAALPLLLGGLGQQGLGAQPPGPGAGLAPRGSPLQARSSLGWGRASR